MADEYTLEQIEAEIARRERSQRLQAASTGQAISVDAIDAELARRAQAPRQPVRGQSAPLMQEAEGALSSINRNIPFAQDVSGIGRGVMAASQTAATPGTSLQDILQSGIGGYQSQIQRGRAASQDFAARRPNVAALAEGTGTAIGVLPALATGGAAAPASTLRGLPLFGRQMATGAATGGAYGFAYGAGAGDAPGQPLEERVQRGNEALVPGAALGAAMPAAANAIGAGLNTLRPAWQAIANPRPLATQAAESGAGVFGTQMFGGRAAQSIPRTAPPPVVPPEAMGTIARMAGDAEMSAEQVGSALARARANPQGQVLVDVFGEQGVRRFRPIVQGPGQTGTAAARTARERIQAAPGRIAGALERGLGVGESRAAAVARLESDYRDLATQAYAPLWRREMTAGERALYRDRIAPMLDPQNPNEEVRRIMQRARRNAQRQFDLDRQVGRVTGTFDENLPRMLHYIKQEIGNVADFEASPLRGTSGNRLGTLRQLYRQFADLLDPPQNSPIQGAIIPDYRRISANAGDYFSATRALEDGAQWLRMRPEEVRVARESMSPFELYHARVALADEVRHATRGRVVGNQNVAAKLDDPDIQGALREAFDTPEQAADFLDNTLNTQNELARNALQWGSGSPTYANSLFGADEAMNAVVEGGANLATGNLSGAFRPALNAARNAVTLGAMGRVNNIRGETLLRRVDSPDSEEFARAIVAELRRREAAGAAATRRTQAGAAIGGAAIERQRRN